MTFDPTINAGNLIIVGLALIGLIGGWYKFGSRVDMLEFRTKTIEDTLKIMAETSQKHAALDRLLALVDQRVVALEGLVKAANEEITDLRRGRGWIKPDNRKGVDGEY